MKDESTQARDVAWERLAHDTLIAIAPFGYEADVTDLVREHWNLAWDEAYTAATADCEAKVRAAVEATIEEAAKSCDKSALYLAEKVKVDPSSYYKQLFYERHDEANELAESIRALDASAIVARVMGKEEQ